MANFYNSTNMNLPIPVTGVDPGPDWANNVNASLTIVDSHNHSTGSGVQITPSGLNISSDLSFISNNAINLRSTRWTAQSVPLALASDLNCAYVSGVDLYYNDGSGNQVRITQSGGVAGSPGSISNLTSPASAAYVSASSTFVWQSAANTPANMDGGAFIFRNITSGSNGVTVQAPAALASNYTITLPLNPASLSFVTLDNSGNLGTATSVSAAQIAAGSITGSQLINATITTTQIAATTIVAGNIANATITGTQIASNVNLAGKAVQENSLNVVVSNTNATNSLSIIRGTVSAAGAKTSGEGFTVSRSSTGNYAVVFTTNFGDVPAMAATAQVSNIVACATTVGVSGFGIQLLANASAPNDTIWSFIAIGQRA